MDKNIRITFRVTNTRIPLLCVCVIVNRAAAVNISLHCCVSYPQGRDKQPHHVHISIPCPNILDIVFYHVRIIRCVH